MAKQPLDLFVPHKAPNHRQKRVAQELRFYLSQVIMRGDWPVRYDDQGAIVQAPCSITVSDVTISPDLKHATIWVMPLGGKYQEETKVFLGLMGGYLRKQIATQLQLRVVPALRFELDPSFGKMTEIDEILKKI